jgi:hypothetical protein
VILLKFWSSLAVRYRLPRRQRVKGPSIGLVRDLLLRRSFLFAHCFILSHLDQPADASGQFNWIVELRGQLFSATPHFHAVSISNGVHAGDCAFLARSPMQPASVTLSAMIIRIRIC